MPRTKSGEISRRLKAKAIRLLGATVDDESAPIYLRVMSARSLLAQPKAEPKPDVDEGEFPNAGRIIILPPGATYEGEHEGFVVVLPSNGRERLAEERERQRLERLTEVEIIVDDDDEPALIAEPEPVVNKRELARRIRERRKAAREAAF